MRKILTVFLTVSVMLSLIGCSGNTTSLNSPDTAGQTGESINAEASDTKKETKENMTLYFCYSDSLDPYKSESSGNRALCYLLFDPLVKLDSDLNPKNVIASNVDQNGKNITVTLNSYVFSDGTEITADDVIYSIERCKKSKNGAFGKQLENISSYRSEGNQIILTLKHYDCNAVNILDFPIIKKGTENQTNSDGKSVPPTGSGRYVLVDNYGEFWLKGNENYHGTVPKNKIFLKNTPDLDSLEYLIRSQSISVYYSGFDKQEMPQLKGESKSVTLTNLVYIGINQKQSVLYDKNIRNAISSAVDRKNISQKCYYSLSKPALSLFTDKSDIKGESENIFNSEDNSTQAAEYLSKSGYKTLGGEGFYENNDKEYITLSLLYNKENNIQVQTATSLVKQFKACGINVTADGKATSDYKTAIKNGDYQLYLAEIRLNKNFDYTSMLKSKIVTAKEKDLPSDLKKEFTDFSDVYEQYMKGDISTDVMLKSFASEMPFVPIVFRVGTVSYKSSFSKELIASISDPYYNIESINLK